MRVNVYSEEITGEVLYIEKKSNTGRVFGAVQFPLHSSHVLHNTPTDDDRSAVTFWLPSTEEGREALANSLLQAANFVRMAPFTPRQE